MNDMKHYLNNTAERARVRKLDKERTTSDKSEPRKQCDQCPFSTIYRCDFRRHIQKHRDARFSCSECNWPFLSQGHLNGHTESVHGIKQSSEERVWKQCEKCEYKTRHTSDIAKHRRRHDSALGHCKFCNRPFCHLGRLTRHMIFDHGNHEKQTENNDDIPSVKEIRAKRIDEFGNENQEQSNTTSVTERERQHGFQLKSDLSKVDSVKEKVQSQRKKAFRIKHCEKRRKHNHKTKTTKKRKTKNGNIIIENHKPEIYLEGTDTEKKDEPSIHTMVVPNEPVSPEVESYESPNLGKQINCAFCGFKTMWYNELKKHLDEHDIIEFQDQNDTVREGTYEENGDEFSRPHHLGNSCSSDSNISTDIVVDTRLCTDDIESHSIDDKDTQNLLNNSVTFAHEEGHTAESKDNTDATDNEDFTSEAEVIDANEFTDADKILSRCLAIIESESRDEFQMKPFACAKCLFKTGDVDYLTVHVEAHLFETARLEHCRRERSDIISSLEDRDDQSHAL